MRELKQDWRDLFGGFKVAFDIWKLVLAFLGLAVTSLCLWAITDLSKPLTAFILAGLVVVGIFIRFVTSERGLTARKLVGLVGMIIVLGGVVVLLWFMLPDLILPVSGLLILLVVWALFGGAISRIAVVEICTDDRVSIGEALGYARKRYTAFLGATILPLIAVALLLLCCYAYGLLFTLPIVNIVLAALFFLVIIAGFMITLILLGGVAGSGLMYPAVAAEGNDAFDAISRSYSYVFGRPWRFLFYNLMGFIYAVGCVFFVSMFILGMLWVSTSAVNCGTDGGWNEQISPRVQTYIYPVLQPTVDHAMKFTDRVASVDPTGFVANLCRIIASRVDQAIAGLSPNPDPGQGEAAVGVESSSILIAIAVYGLLGLVLSYIVSLFYSLQACIYLLLRRTVDGADMTEVYLEEEMEEEPAKPAETPAKQG
jgi:hypothetical protein